MQHILSKSGLNNSSEPIVFLGRPEQIYELNPDHNTRYIIGADLVFNLYGKAEDMEEFEDFVHYDNIAAESISPSNLLSFLKGSNEVIAVYVHRAVYDIFDNEHKVFLSISSYVQTAIRKKGANIVVGGMIDADLSNLEIVYAVSGKITNMSERSFQGSDSPSFEHDLAEELAELKTDNPGATFFLAPPLDEQMAKRFDFMHFEVVTEQAFRSPLLKRFKPDKLDTSYADQSALVRYRYVLPGLVIAGGVGFSAFQAGAGYVSYQSSVSEYSQMVKKVEDAYVSHDIDQLEKRQAHLDRIESKKANQIEALHAATMHTVVAAAANVEHSIIKNIKITDTGTLERVQLRLSVPLQPQFAAIEQAEAVIDILSNHLSGRLYVNDTGSEVLESTSLGRNVKYREFSITIDRNNQKG